MLAPRLLTALLAVLLALGLAACGGGGGGDDGGGTARPQVGIQGDEPEAARDLGFPSFATKNTTRVGGADAVANAAAVARAVFPSEDAKQRPKAVALVDKDDWHAGLVASALIADPVGAPVLLTDGDDLPEATEKTLDALAPTGSREAGNAQVVRVGEDVAKPDDLKATDVEGKDPAQLAAAMDAVLSAARGRTSDNVVVVSSESAEYAMPAAGWAAKSGDPVLFVGKDAVPAVTKAALERHQQPRIYVLGPPDVVSAKVEKELKRLGTVKRITEGKTPVENAIAFARYVDGGFGWGVRDPGHGLLFVGEGEPLDAVAAAPLSASGTYGPVLLHTGAETLDKPLDDYLQDIRPGYRRNPVRGVYNHGWIVGDEKAMSLEVQARIDSLLEISLVETDSPSS